MQLHPAIEASETAQFAAPLYGFHVMLASLPGEPGSLLPRKMSGKRHCYNTYSNDQVLCFQGVQMFKINDLSSWIG